MSGTQGNTSIAIKPWIEVAALHSDVVSEHFSEDIFALDLGPLADGKPNVPAVYRDPEHFFRVSFLTKGLRSLLQDVLSRLSDGAGNRVLKLLTLLEAASPTHSPPYSMLPEIGKRWTFFLRPRGCQDPRTSTPRCSTVSSSTRLRARKFPVRNFAHKPCGAGSPGRLAA